MTEVKPSSNKSRTGVLAVVNELPRDWADCFRTIELEAQRTGMPIRVAALDAGTIGKFLQGVCAELADEWSLSKAAMRMFRDYPSLDCLLVVTAPVAIPNGMLDRASAWVIDDGRIATVSFLSNAAGALSFPHRNTASAHGVPGADEHTITASLRGQSPDIGPVPISLPSGPAILISRAVLASVGGFDESLDAHPRESIAELSLRAARRGFQHRLDAGTYLTSQWFDGFPAQEPTEDEQARHRLHRIDSSFPALFDQQRAVDTSPAAIAMNVARSKVLGLRLLIDGSCLGPMEMGTQVQTVELVRALSRRSDVQSIALAVPHGHVPSYATDLLVNGKVSICDSRDLQFAGAQMVDVLHRPYQPDSSIPWERWRNLSKRVLVTLQDLIAYRIGAYHLTGEDWLRYRHNISDACAKADGVVAISDDTRISIEEECLGVSVDRLYVIKNGSNHLDESAIEEVPTALVEKGMIAASFILVLGASYAHKNRDIGIRVWQMLRERGHQVALVMAGANVPKGSSRSEEAIARRSGDDLLITMPDVSSGVRTWLLRHASVVLYPTSAEGFGLVPFEAAALGTPTAHVSFGPLRELVDSPSLPRQWSVEDLANYTQELLVNPTAAQENIARILRGGSSLTWDETARGLVEAYRDSLARAPRF